MSPRSRAVAEADADAEPTARHHNSVALLGRLADVPEERELPSGDLLLTFRLVIDRPTRSGQGRRQVDTIDCAAWSTRVQRSVRAWSAGDLVTVEGRLRRRFLRGSVGISRIEVEVTRARRARASAR